MALPVRKGYKGAAAQAVLTNSPSDSDTSFVLDTVTGWPTTFPFYAVVNPGTSKEEKVKVTAISTLTATVVRAQDDTTASAHSAGAAMYPVFTADEADEANQIASAMTTKGDLIATDGSAINRLAVGTNTHVLQADSTATNGFKWGQVATAGLADSAVTTAKINDAAVTADKIASAVAGSGLAGGAGSALSVNVDSSTIEINSDTLRVKDAGIVAAKLASNAVETAKILDDAVTNAKLAGATGSWTPTAAYNVSSATGTYYIIGDLLAFEILAFLTGTISSANTFRVGLPSGTYNTNMVGACRVTWTGGYWGSGYYAGHTEVGSTGLLSPYVFGSGGYVTDFANAYNGVNVGSGAYIQFSGVLHKVS